MNYLHTMVRVRDIDDSLNFYCNLMGLEEHSRMENEKGRFTLIFLRAPGDKAAAEANKAPLLELTYNWPEDGKEPETYTVEGRGFGHLAYRVDNIYDACQKLMDGGVTINRPRVMVIWRSSNPPEGISIEILQKGDYLEPAEPWESMENSGSW